MKNHIVLGLIQMSMSSDSEENGRKAIRMIYEASERGAQIVCLPELFTTLYFPREEKIDASGLAETIPGKTTEILSKAAKEKNVVVVGGSIFEKEGGKFYNTSVVFDETGNAYVTGFFTGEAQFGNFKFTTSKDEKDIFIVIYTFIIHPHSFSSGNRNLSLHLKLGQI